MNGVIEKIQKHPFFSGMKPQHLAIIAECAHEARFGAGEVLFREGSPANRFFLVESGCVALEAHAPGQVTRLIMEVGAGEVLGWSWLFPPFVWHFEARALEPSNTITISGAHLLISAEKDHDFGYELMKRVAKVVINRLQATRQQLLEELIESAGR